MLKKRKFTILLLIAFVAAGIFFSFSANALGLTPFGGSILLTRYGNNCIVIDVGPPRGGEYIFMYGSSRLYAFSTIRVGAFVLGIAGPTTTCFLKKVPIGAGGTILKIGTSF